MYVYINIMREKPV